MEKIRIIKKALVKTNGIGKKRINGDDFFGIILITCLVLSLVFRGQFYRIHFLESVGWVAVLSTVVGALLLISGCVLGYLSHEVFHKAMAADGQIHQLLKTRPYKWVQHPFYLSLGLISASFVLILKSWFMLAGWVIATAVLLNETHKEEKELLEKFGDEYAAYQRKTGRFFPRVLDNL